jgi:hypothetical protein
LNTIAGAVHGPGSAGLARAAPTSKRATTTIASTAARASRLAPVPAMRSPSTNRFSVTLFSCVSWLPELRTTNPVTDSAHQKWKVRGITCALPYAARQASFTICFGWTKLNNGTNQPPIAQPQP